VIGTQDLSELSELDAVTQRPDRPCRELRLVKLITPSTAISRSPTLLLVDPSASAVMVRGG